MTDTIHRYRASITVLYFAPDTIHPGFDVTGTRVIDIAVDEAEILGSDPLYKPWSRLGLSIRDQLEDGLDAILATTREHWHRTCLKEAGNGASEHEYLAIFWAKKENGDYIVPMMESVAAIRPSDLPKGLIMEQHGVSRLRTAFLGIGYSLPVEIAKREPALAAAQWPGEPA